jgi:hypothetical protein
MFLEMFSIPPNKTRIPKKLLKWYLQQGLVITKFYCSIKYTPEKSFQQFPDEVSDA